MRHDAQMPLEVLESLCLPRSPNARNLDRLVVTDHLAAVVDGSTVKPWHEHCLGGGTAADCVHDALLDVDEGASVADVVSRLTESVRKAKRAAGCHPRQGGGATVAALLLRQRLVVRIGDPWVRIGSVVHSAVLPAEAAVAASRALIATVALDGGATVAELREKDAAREAVLPLLQALDGLRNHPTSPWGFGAVDGGSIPARFVECWPLLDDEHEVVLASDGYLALRDDLKGSERELAARLERDPLLIEQPPATKGSPAAGASYDDRTFLKLRVPTA